MVSTYFNFDYAFKQLLSDHRKRIKFYKWNDESYLGIDNDNFYMNLGGRKTNCFPSFSEINTHGWSIILPYNKDYPEFRNDKKENIKESV